ncbi:hypothetical protein [Motilimonas sp. 1_MG-2023]|uniref:hypothetical protein n=1 Tax=Motilimonas TaxID=1914248 RepID=UPI0026E46C7C|nr:hypothetical protein [Motilimonas sp. 1_MG-2023]MDO6525706.1 hypothetical protein [Motilimonas sp. 1_MG-2023]
MPSSQRVLSMLCLTLWLLGQGVLALHWQHDHLSEINTLNDASCALCIHAKQYTSANLPIAISLVAITLLLYITRIPATASSRPFYAAGPRAPPY